MRWCRVIIIVVVIIIIALKGVIFTTSSLLSEMSATRMLKWPGCSCVQITCNTSSAYHVQPALCCLVQRDSSVVKFDRVEIAFILSVVYWLKPLTD